MFGLSPHICRQTYAHTSPRERSEVIATKEVIRVSESQGLAAGLGFF